jgi:hypothetical protein
MRGTKKGNTVIDKLMSPCHQGDVFIVKVSDEISPINGKKVEMENGRLVVQHGEAIGHYHTIEDPQAVELVSLELDGAVKKMVMNVLRETNLVHPEHGTVTFTPGKYEIHTQQEARNGFLRPVID